MSKGFTILELIVVVAIISVLATVLITAVNAPGHDYMICDSDDNCDYVDEYVEKDNCVQYGNAKVCGNYKIEAQNDNAKSEGASTK